MDRVWLLRARERPRPRPNRISSAYFFEHVIGVGPAHLNRPVRPYPYQRPLEPSAPTNVIRLNGIEHKELSVEGYILKIKL
jgi:hypothetical protein